MDLPPHVKVVQADRFSRQMPGLELAHGERYVLFTFHFAVDAPGTADAVCVRADGQARFKGELTEQRNGPGWVQRVVRDSGMTDRWARRSPWRACGTNGLFSSKRDVRHAMDLILQGVLEIADRPERLHAQRAQGRPVHASDF